ncbi:hypothetical protein M501DRAFT_584539 [Patellaria atrata CBS 101060]|uniref:Heterokaryon incompatibility domain-containing protein n=1 Tax=Patellaria atrata CBS 101060 TaxID=1346257 RepID=A0A9P4SFG2_9PEZI|nr:hypothetical protein M501DRAFT_584539 [Patellaria atrata CBS 101060]
MDTLCIPVRSNLADLRAKAINRMDLIYVSVEKVLVLDRKMQAIEVPSLLSRENFRFQLDGRLFCSTWLSRAWTLQEGIVGRRAFIQLQDITISFYLAQSHWMTRIYIHLRYRYDQSRSDHRLCLSRISDIVCTSTQRYFEKHRADFFANTRSSVRSEQYILTWNHMLERVTSQIEDLHVVIANLLDFSAMQIMQAAKGDRMSIILSRTGSIPADILFSAGRRANAGMNCSDR